MIRRIRIRASWGPAAALPVLALLLVSASVQASTVTVTLSGPESFARDTAAPTAATRTFSVPAAGGSFLLKVENGSGTGDNAVSAAVIRVNGITIVKTSDLSQQAAYLERPLSNLVRGANTLEVEVRSIPSSYLSVSIEGTYLLGISITSPLAGASLASDRATVTGICTAYTPDVGIVVNGVRAAVSGGSFVAEDVPLAPGANTLSATITTFDGIKAQDAISVAATGEDPPLALGANITSGIPPVTASFRPQIEGIAPVEYRYDFDGDGVIDNTVSSDEAVSFTYTVPGSYRARVIAVDAAGRETVAEKTVVVEDPGAVHTLLSGRWHALSSSLQAQDVEGSLANLLPERREKYRAVFLPLASQLPSIFGSLPAPELVAVEEHVAQYRVRRDQMWEGAWRTITYYLWFVRDQDGIWRIDKF